MLEIKENDFPYFWPVCFHRKLQEQKHHLEPLLAPTEWLVQRGNQLADVGE